MTLIIRTGETQRDFVRRTLREQGEISVQACLFDMRDDEGNPRAITRLAAIIHDLRHKDGMAITEYSPVGKTSVYRYSAPEAKQETLALEIEDTAPLPSVGPFTLDVPCPVVGCTEQMHTNQMHTDPTDSTIGLLPCSKHGWQKVRLI